MTQQRPFPYIHLSSVTLVVLELEWAARGWGVRGGGEREGRREERDATQEIASRVKNGRLKNAVSKEGTEFLLLDDVNVL